MEALLANPHQADSLTSPALLATPTFPRDPIGPFSAWQYNDIVSWAARFDVGAETPRPPIAVASVINGDDCTESRQTMSLTIDLPPELERVVRQHAAASGQDVGVFVLHAVREKIAKARTFDEVCAPFARAVHETGITDDEFDRFFERAREEVWQAKQGKAT